MPPIIDTSKCTHCYRCVQLCALDVFGAQEKTDHAPLVQYPDECWHCRACVMDCPVHAINLRYPLPYLIASKKPE